eukprot:7395895-Pyramimonas_sp.AAC.1
MKDIFVNLAFTESVAATSNSVGARLAGQIEELEAWDASLPACNHTSTARPYYKHQLFHERPRDHTPTGKRVREGSGSRRHAMCVRGALYRQYTYFWCRLHALSSAVELHNA